jgi:hypothetical protein
MIHTQFQSQRYNGCSEATTIRQASTSLLTIDSADRFTNRTEERTSAVSLGQYNISPYDFTITKNESIMNGFFTRLAVSEVVMPWPFTNINNRTNTIILFYQPGGVGPSLQQTISLPNGYYRPSQIAAAMTLAVAVYVPGFTMVYSPVTAPGLPSYAPMCFQWGTGSSTKVSFGPMTPNTPGVYPYNDQTTQLFDVLGFTSENGGTSRTTDVGTTTLCQDVQYVDIVCAQLTYNQSLKDTSSQRTVRDALCRVYLSSIFNSVPSTVAPEDPDFCPPGCAPTTVYINYSTPKQIQWSPNQPVPSGLTFQVYDDNGILLTTIGNLTSLNWSLTLLVSEN